MSAATLRHVIAMPISKLVSHPLNIRVYGTLETDKNFLDSIQRWGVIDPIVYQPVSFDNGQTFVNIIVSGHRRFLAARTFKFFDVPVRVALPDHEPIVSEDDLLAIERLVIEANRQRVKTHEQIGREFIELQRIEKRAAALRQQAGKATPETLTLGNAVPQVQKGRARDIAAASLGVSGKTAEKISKIIEKADAGDTQAKTVLDDLAAKRVSVTAGYLKAMNIQNDKENPTSNRAQRRQEFLKSHPDWVGHKNSELDKEIQRLDAQNKRPKTPCELANERLKSLYGGGPVLLKGASWNTEYRSFSVSFSATFSTENQAAAVKAALDNALAPFVEAGTEGLPWK